MTLAVSVGILVAGGVYLLLQRGLVRVVLGFMLLSHAVNLLLIAAGVTATREVPFLGMTDAEDAADPLPQAFVLTAIVISFAITVYMLTLAAVDRDDDTEEDTEEDT